MRGFLNVERGHNRIFCRWITCTVDNLFDVGHFPRIVWFETAQFVAAVIHPRCFQQRFLLRAAGLEGLTVILDQQIADRLQVAAWLENILIAQAPGSHVRNQQLPQAHRVTMTIPLQLLSRRNGFAQGLGLTL